MPQNDTMLAMYLNQLTQSVLLKIAKQTAIDLFEWGGLPEGLTTDILEDMLYSQGQVVWFKKDKEGIFALKSASDSERNIYNQPTAYKWYGHNENGTVSADKSVRMKNNPLMSPTHEVVEYFVNKLYQVERTLDNHVVAHKVSKVIAGNSDTLLSVKNMLKKIDDNEVNIITGKSFSLDDLEVLDLEFDFIIDKLADYRNEIQNQMNTFFGINNANTDKKERLITDEVTANNDAISRNVAYMLRERQEAVKAINEMFGLAVTVKLAHQSEPVEQEEQEEEEEDGSI